MGECKVQKRHTCAALSLDRAVPFHAPIAALQSYHVVADLLIKLPATVQINRTKYYCLWSKSQEAIAHEHGRIQGQNGRETTNTANRMKNGKEYMTHNWVSRRIWLGWYCSSLPSMVHYYRRCVCVHFSIQYNDIMNMNDGESRKPKKGRESIRKVGVTREIKELHTPQRLWSDCALNAVQSVLEDDSTEQENRQKNQLVHEEARKQKRNAKCL